MISRSEYSDILIFLVSAQAENALKNYKTNGFITPIKDE